MALLFKRMLYLGRGEQRVCSTSERAVDIRSHSAQAKDNQSLPSHLLDSRLQQKTEMKHGGLHA